MFPGVVNDIIYMGVGDAESQFCVFNEEIFRRPFWWENFIKIGQR